MLSILRRNLIFSGAGLAAAALAPRLVGVAYGAVGTVTAQDTVLVAGATGAIGKLVVQLLLEQGAKVRALSRNPAAAKKAEPRADWAAGDFLDPKSIENAAKGVTKIVFAAGSRPSDDPKNSIEAVDYGGVVSLVEAGKKSGASHFVLVSSAGVTQPAIPGFPASVLEGIKWKGRSEAALRESGIPYTILRPFGLDNRPAGQMGIVFLQGDKIMAHILISRSDLAAVAVHALYEPKAQNVTLELFNAQTAAIDGWKKGFVFMRADVPAEKHG
jgi:uncharacterized protein YbjT (DUF2867 family)